MIPTPIERKKRRVRSVLSGRQNGYPRLSVHRTSKHIYAQVIDDTHGHTLTAASDIDLKIEKKTKTEKAIYVGAAIADALTKLKVQQVVFDRGYYKYAGRVAALAKAVREGGITI